MKESQFAFENSIPQNGTYREDLISSGEKSRGKQPNFDPNAQRLRLLRAGGFRLLITTLVCTLLGVSIYSFDTLDRGITSGERRGFNTLVVALAMTLSLILFHSLEWCAQVIRWRVLTLRFYSPEEFNLIYDCDRKLSNLRLFWVARTPGRRWPNKIQLLVLFYLLISIALLVDTALLGLTYSVEVSPIYKMTKKGMVSVANLTTISPIKNTLAAQYSQAQNYGLISQGFIPIESSLQGNDPGPSSILSVQYDLKESVFWYRFVDMSVTNIRNYDMSDRYIISNATCREVKLVSGGYGGITNVTTGSETNGTTIRIQDGDEPVQDLYIGELQAPGSITWLGSIDMGGGECGPRCAHIWALQSPSNPAGPTEKPRFWKCTNTVSRMLNAGNATVDLSDYDMPDKWAQVMAGAIGFSGISTPDAPYQRVLYPDGNAFAPMANLTSPEIMAGTIMWFSVGGFGAMDGFGPRFNITSNDEPIAAQVVTVQWQYTSVVLVIPPLVQALVLVAVIMYGNNTIVRDAGALSTAALLKSIVDDRLHNQSAVHLEKDTLGLSDSKRLRYRPHAPMESVGDESTLFVRRSSSAP